MAAATTANHIVTSPDGKVKINTSKLNLPNGTQTSISQTYLAGSPYIPPGLCRRVFNLLYTAGSWFRVYWIAAFTINLLLAASYMLPTCSTGANNSRNSSSALHDYVDIRTLDGLPIFASDNMAPQIIKTAGRTFLRVLFSGCSYYFHFFGNKLQECTPYTVETNYERIIKSNVDVNIILMAFLGFIYLLAITVTLSPFIISTDIWAIVYSITSGNASNSVAVLASITGIMLVTAIFTKHLLRKRPDKTCRYVVRYNNTGQPTVAIKSNSHAEQQ